MRAFLARLVLGLYPRSVRERYGDEIAELLRDSPTPLRDLADVALTAAAEHAATVSAAGFGKGALRFLGLVSFPYVVLFVWLSGTAAGGILVEVMGLSIWEGPYFPAAAFVVPAVPVFLLTWLLARRSQVRRPAVVLPVVFAFAVLILASIPGSGSTPWQVWTGQEYWPGPNTLVGERWDGTSVAVLIWLAGMLLIGRLRRVRWAAKAILAFAVLEVAIAAYILNTFPAGMKPISEAWLWYPVGLVSQEGFSGLAGGLLEDTLKLLPQTLTVLTVFILVRTRRTHGSAATVTAVA